MTTLTGPAVTVSSAPRFGGIQLTFRSHRAGVAPFVHVISDRVVIDNERKELDEGLTELKNRLPDLNDHDTDLTSAYAELRRLGLSLVLGLFGMNRSVRDEMRTFWRAAVPTWCRPGPGPLVQCLGDEASMLPLELLPVFDLGGPDKIANRDELVRRCRAFLGFSAIVRRSFVNQPVPRPLPLRRDSTGRIPLRFLYYDGLLGAHSEREWFGGPAAGCVDLEGPYPDADEGAPSISRQIYDPAVLLAGGRRTLPDQIQHFSCHCFAQPDVAWRKYEIELRGGGREIRLTLDDLGTQVLRFIDDAVERPDEMPLVFMNACGSSVLRATTAMSFPVAFLQNGNRGFVGTEIAVPDDVAAVFSRFVYERLLLEGRPLGEAILGARIELLQRYGNPLGLVYTAYADPELRIDPAPPLVDEGVA